MNRFLIRTWISSVMAPGACAECSPTGRLYRVSVPGGYRECAVPRTRPVITPAMPRVGTAAQPGAPHKPGLGAARLTALAAYLVLDHLKSECVSVSVPHRVVWVASRAPRFAFRVHCQATSASSAGCPYRSSCAALVPCAEVSHVSIQRDPAREMSRSPLELWSRISATWRQSP